MIEQPMETAPKDGTEILLKVDGLWVQGNWETIGSRSYWWHLLYEELK